MQGPSASAAVREGVRRRSTDFLDDTKLLVVTPRGELETRALPFKPGNRIKFIRRHELVEALAEAVESDPGIELLRGVEAEVRLGEGGRAKVKAGDAEMAPDLVVGADGIGSAVRGAAQGWRPGSFEVEAKESPATGLRYKVRVQHTARRGRLTDTPTTQVLNIPASLELRSGERVKEPQKW